MVKPLASQGLPVLKQLECPNCGSNIDQHTYNTQTLVCKFCHTHVTFGGDSGLEKTQGIRLPDAPVPIKPGDSATFDGIEYFVLGRVVYQGWDPEEPSDRWTWHEWLLGGKNGKFVWLSYSSDEGFLLSKRVRIKLPFDPKFGNSIPVDEKNNFYVKERYPARVFGVEGELTWQAKRDDQHLMVEGASSSASYSVQYTDHELEMYRGTQVNEQEIANAFGKPEWLQKLKTTAQNRSTYGILAGLAFLMGCLGLIFAAGASASGEEVLDRKLTLNRADTTPQSIAIDFSQTGRPAEISLTVLSGIPQNSAVNPEIEVVIVDPEGKATDLTTQEFWHETGFDDEGSWTDKRDSGGKRFVPNKKGTHQLQISLEDSPVESVDVQVKVKRNEILYSWFLCYGILAFVLGAFFVVSAAPKAVMGTLQSIAEAADDD